MNPANVLNISSVPDVRPGLRFGTRPMKAPDIGDLSEPWLKRFDGQLARLLNRWQLGQNSFAAFLPTYQAISRKVAYYSDLPTKEFHQCATTRPTRANRARTLEQLQDDFAICLLACERTLGLRPHPEQVYAAWHMRFGLAVEMQTGEGKSLVAALTAAVVARSGTRVHVITVNDYLVARDCQTSTPLFEFLNLKAATSQASDDETKRRLAYASDITYVTAKQLAFDYLRDRLSGNHRGGVVERLAALSAPAGSQASKPQPLLAGLSFAIVDELDNVMIDDARTPMILARACDDEPQSDNRAEISVAIGLASALHEDVDFRIQRESGGIWITDQGQAHLAELGERFKGVWQFQRYRSERVRQALQCLHLFKRDHDYVVRDGKVELLDQSTGRIMSDRRLQDGMHSFLEVLEKCELTSETKTRISTSFQFFFRRFHTLSGMSGTLGEARAELASSYGLHVLDIPSHRPTKRQHIANEMVIDRAAFADAIVSRVKSRHRKGQPLLLATANVEQSRWVSSILSAHELEHQVLDAVQDGDEAAIISTAGQASAITVATNMAGRGTDIPLDDNASAAGGLHVLLLAVNESKRCDRQIYGRAARQGDPGSSECLLSLDDDLLKKELPTWVLRSLRTLVRRSPAVGSRLGFGCVSVVKIRLARRYIRLRKAVVREHYCLQRMLAFGESN